MGEHLVGAGGDNDLVAKRCGAAEEEPTKLWWVSRFCSFCVFFSLPLRFVASFLACNIVACASIERGTYLQASPSEQAAAVAAPEAAPENVVKVDGNSRSGR